MDQLLRGTAQTKRWLAISSLRFYRSSLPWLLSGLFISGAASAAPYIPAGDDEVLINLSGKSSSNALADGAGSAFGSNDLSEPQRISSAQALLALAYEEANEDAFGQAEALLAPWAEHEEPGSMPIEVRYMLAVIRQHNHEFMEAVALLDAVLEQQPAFGSALLQRAQINLVLGNYAASRQDCISLRALASTAIAANCAAQVAAVTGSAHETYAQITSLAGYQSFFAPAEYTELMLTLATITHRLGLVDETERFYRLVLGQNSNNVYALLQYTDFLLEQQRFTEVTELLSELPAAQLTLELQVKQLEALRAGNPAAAYAMKHAELAAVFTIARTRAENFPQKEYARFLLLNPEHSQEALQAALANWQYQKEPGDLLLLVRTAIAANSSKELELARDWLANTGLEDQRISSLLDGSSHNKNTTHGETEP